MKKIYVFMLLLSCLLSASAMGKTMVNKSYYADEIDLHGDIPANKQRSLIKPVQTFITDQSIEVNFNVTLGTIVISIYDETGNAVYQQSENANSGQQIFIDITSFDRGEYTIEFVNSQNQYLSGDFEI